MLGHAAEEVRRRPHVGGKRTGVLVGDAAGKLDRGVGGDRGAQRRRELVEMLMREQDADVVLARLRQQRFQIIVEIFRRLVDDEESRFALGQPAERYVRTRRR